MGDEMPSSKKGYVYILFNRRNGTLYTGVTSGLIRRVYEHKERLVEGFSKKYSTDKLGYYEECATVVEAIEREKQIKKRSRTYKLGLIEKDNPKWLDLYDTLV
jgi:putative endonuclease